MLPPRSGDGFETSEQYLRRHSLLEKHEEAAIAQRERERAEFEQQFEESKRVYQASKEPKNGDDE